jgi:hypothetical protein
MSARVAPYLLSAVQAEQGGIAYVDVDFQFGLRCVDSDPLHLRLGSLPRTPGALQAEQFVFGTSPEAETVVGRSLLLLVARVTRWVRYFHGGPPASVLGPGPAFAALPGPTSCRCRRA